MIKDKRVRYKDVNGYERLSDPAQIIMAQRLVSKLERFGCTDMEIVEVDA